MHLIRTGVIFGAGWVLGARAGRERYEQVAATASLVAERPEVRRVTEPVIAFFTGSGDGGAPSAPPQVRKAVETVRQQATQVAGQVASVAGQAASKVSSVRPGTDKPAQSAATEGSAPASLAPGGPASDSPASDSLASDSLASDSLASDSLASDSPTAETSPPKAVLDADPEASGRSS